MELHTQLELHNFGSTCPNLKIVDVSEFPCFLSRCLTFCFFSSPEQALSPILAPTDRLPVVALGISAPTLAPGQTPTLKLAGRVREFL